MQRIPTGMRLKIGLIGRCNSGKSTILNALTHQPTSIVSEIPGTTTDPVQKTMELLPLGPVVFYDTAGLDDSGLLGVERIKRTRRLVRGMDIAILVVDSGKWESFEENLLNELVRQETAVVVVFNKSDLAEPHQETVDYLQEKGIPHISAVASQNQGIELLRSTLIKIVPEESRDNPTIFGDLLQENELVVLVTPIDSEAPKHRLILPQVQSIRDVLDHHAMCLVVKEHQLEEALKQLKTPPKLVVTDSQAFAMVSKIVPGEIPLTSFSILFARLKGDLNIFMKGGNAIETLTPDSKILIAEACNHHPTEEDIGTIKIPQWLEKKVGGKLQFSHVRSHDFPDSDDELSQYSLVIHCGSCMLTRKEVLVRQNRCEALNIPITNYGITIAHILGITDRALQPFMVNTKNS